MKRQRGRNRGGGGGGKPQHNANRAFDSNGPDGVKIRGAAQHVYEKYQQLARDAGSAGDRVLAENYLQHAEHYFRLLRAVQPQRPLAEIVGRDQFASGYDIDFEDESANVEAGEGADGEAQEGAGDGRFEQRQDRFEGRQRDERPREERPRDERPRDERPREEYRRDERPREQRDDRPRGDRFRDRDRFRDDRPRDDRPRDERPRDDRPREERPRDDRPRDERPRERFERGERDAPARDPLNVVEPEATPLVARPEPAREQPTRVLRADDGEVSHAPAFLQARPPEPQEGEPAEARKPRRRRAPRSFEGGDPSPAAADGDEG